MSKRVLIVDDAPFMREVLRQILERAGFMIVGEAQDGEEAVELCKKHQPDCVLMDLVMPYKSGLEATREIMSVLPETRVIAVSTLDDESVVAQALDAGCAHYISKPFKGDEIIRTIQSVYQGVDHG